MAQLIIGFSKSKKKLPIYSWLIMLFQGTNFSHVYIKWWNSSHKEWMYYQASGTMVNFMGEEAFNKLNETVEEYNITIDEQVKHEVVKFAIKNAGKPYSVDQILAILANKVGLSVDMGSSDSAYICSELVAKILLYVAKVKNFAIDKPIDLVTPKDIRDYLRKMEL